MSFAAVVIGALSVKPSLYNTDSTLPVARILDGKYKKAFFFICYKVPFHAISIVFIMASFDFEALFCIRAG